MSKRAERKLATHVALRRAAIALMSERGYDATPTDDIARAAGVSPRTFFNYFPTKEQVLLLPENLLNDIVVSALRRRPAGEDVVASLAAAAVDSAGVVATLGGQEDSESLLLSTLRLMFSESTARAVFLERRFTLEEAIWATLRERGVAEGDVGARSAVTTVVGLTYLGLGAWVDGEGSEPLPAVVARYIVSAPDPARFAAGVAAPTVRSRRDGSTGA